MATKTDNSSKNFPYTKQTDEDRWECKICLTKNLTSEKRCQSCAKPRGNRQSSTVDSSHTTTVEEQYGHSPSPDAYRATDGFNFTKSSKKGKYICRLVPFLEDTTHFGSSWRSVAQNLNKININYSRVESENFKTRAFKLQFDNF